jgi:hypothetical protein
VTLYCEIFQLGQMNRRMSFLEKIFPDNKKRNKSPFKNRIYFKVINFNKAEGAIDPERLESMQEYEGEYNFELNNDYFENAWFYSDSDRELVEFQVFFTMHAHFRYPEFYKEAQKIQDYFEVKYQTPFFYTLSNEELRKKYHPEFQLGKHLNLTDFKSIVFPNLKLNLLSTINLDGLANKNNYVFFNWDFFEEVQISPFSNSFLRYIERLPFSSRQNSYETIEKAKINAVNVLLENASSTVDTTLKGLDFDIRNFKSKILKGNYSYLSKPKIVPRIRSLRELGDVNEVINNTEFQIDLEASLRELERNTMKPFEIIVKN